MLDLSENTDCRVYECRDCGFKFLYPYFEDMDITRIYRDPYFTGNRGEDHSYVAPATGTAYKEVANARLKKFGDCLDRLKEMFPNARSILDVGCATGEFLLLSSERGFESFGLEVSEYAAAVARAQHGLDVRVGSLERFVAPRQYDLVHLNHVLEHFADPHRAVTALRKILPQGGAVYVEVPFQFNWVERATHLVGGKRVQFSVHSIHHPLFFAPKTLVRLFAMHSFRVSSVRVFEWGRYPKSAVVDWAKCLAWMALSAVGQGVFIEAIFVKEGAS